MLRQVFSFSFLVLISRLLGVIRDVIMANILGAGVLSDVFLAAYRLSSSFRAFFTEEGFINIFIPLYSSLKEENPAEAQQFINKIFSLLCVIVALVCLFIVVFASGIVEIFSPGLGGGAATKLCAELIRIMAPHVFFLAISGFVAAIIHVNTAHTVVPIISIILNLSMIVAGMLPIINSAVYNFAYSVLIAGAVNLLFFLFLLNKISLSLSFAKFDFAKEVQEFVKKGGTVALSYIVNNLGIWIELIICSFFTGAISYLYYSARISSFSLGIVGVAVATASLPLLSTQYSRGDKEELFRIKNQSLQLILIFMIPAASGMWLLSERIVEVLLRHGKFSAEAATQTVKALKIACAALPALALNKVLQSMIFAAKEAKLILKLSVINLFLLILLNLILVWKFKYLAVVIAAVINAWLTTGILIYHLKKMELWRINQNFGQGLNQIGFSAVIMIIAIGALDALAIFSRFEIINLIVISAFGFFSYFFALSRLYYDQELLIKIGATHIGLKRIKSVKNIDQK